MVPSRKAVLRHGDTFGEDRAKERPELTVKSSGSMSSAVMALSVREGGGKAQLSVWACSQFDPLKNIPGNHNSL